MIFDVDLNFQGRKVGIKVAMMHAKGKFKVLEKDIFTAVSLPLDNEYINVSDTYLFSILLRPAEDRTQHNNCALSTLVMRSSIS